MVIFRHLSTEIGQEYIRRQEKEAETEDLVELALEVAPFFLAHNAEADAVDLLLQLDIVPKLVGFVDKNSYKRVCLYIARYFHLDDPQNRSHL
jgi:26S proteasome regulatory subunit N1